MMTPTQPIIQAVVLAGVRDCGNALLSGTGLRNKVLLPVGGQPIVLRVLSAIAATCFETERYVSTDDPEVAALSSQMPFQVIPPGGTAVQSFLSAIENVTGDSPWVLLASGDHALLTPDMIEYFVADAVRRDLTFAGAVVSRACVERHYPRSRRTYFPVKGDAYSGGNLYLVNKTRFLANAGVLEIIDGNRKKPWKSMAMLNPWQMMQLLLRRRTMHEVADMASDLIGCKTGFVEMPFAECCMDIDKPSDKAIAEVILARRRAVQEPAALQALLV